MINVKFNPKKVIVHHSANPTPQNQFSSINEDHRQRFKFVSTLGKWGGYHYFIEKSGEVLQYRSTEEVGAHTLGQNDKAIGICLAGNFDHQKPTANQIVSLCKLIDYLLKIHQIPVTEIYPHRTFNHTACYGLMLSDTWAKDQFRNYLTENLNHLLQLLKAYLEKGMSACFGQPS